MTDKSGQGYPGQQGINDSASEYNQHARQITQMLSYVRTAVMVEVMSVDVPNGGLAPVGFMDAKPLVNQMDGGGNCFPHGTVFGLPYFRLQGGVNAFILDPKVGDKGLALICDRDISSVKANKKRSNPGSRRRFSLSDGLYLGGYLNGKPTCYVQVADEKISMTPDDGTTSVIVTPGFIDMKGALRVTGGITAGFGGSDQVGLQTHVHAQPNDSHGDTEQPTNAPTAGS